MLAFPDVAFCGIGSWLRQLRHRYVGRTGKAVFSDRPIRSVKHRSVKHRSGKASLEKHIDIEPPEKHSANMFLRRLGPNPHLHGTQTPALKGCPDLFELKSGDFAIIGRDITPEALSQLPPDASCGPDERIVVIPRTTLIAAKLEIPDR